MGSAIGNVLGGGGGGLLGSIGGIVGGIFGGPIGSMIGQALGNMVQSAVGDAVGQAADTLHREDGMPKFLASQIKQSVKEALSETLHRGVDQQATSTVKDQYGSAMQSFTSDLVKQIVDQVRNEMKKGVGGHDEDGAGRAGSSGGKSSSSWLTAIAKAMGKAMGDKAAKMVDLSNQVSQNKAKSDKPADQQDAAREMQRLNAELQATSQEFSIMQSAFSTAIKGIGEAMSQMARKQ